MKYEYPRIIQIMPCTNIWLRYENKKEDTCFYVRAHCLALLEDKKLDETFYSNLEYMDITNEGFFDIEPGYEGVFYSEEDLSDLTHSLSDERHPSKIIESLARAKIREAMNIE
jgi:hypothetical protein